MAPFYFNSFSILVFLLYSLDRVKKYSIAADSIAKVVQTLKMAKLTANGYLLSQKNVEKTGVSGFSGNLQQNDWQFFRIGQFRFNIPKEFPIWVYKLHQKRKRQIMQKKIVFVQKTQKNGFFGVLRYALQQFGFLLCHSKDAQTHNNTALMQGQGVETEKRQFYRKENCVLGRGMAKEGVFCCFQICTRTLRNITVWLQWCSNVQNSRSIKIKKCSKSIKSQNYCEKMSFSGQKLQKNGFLTFSCLH